MNIWTEAQLLAEPGRPWSCAARRLPDEPFLDHGSRLPGHFLRGHPPLRRFPAARCLTQIVLSSLNHRCFQLKPTAAFSLMNVLSSKTARHLIEDVGPGSLKVLSRLVPVGSGTET